MGVVTGLAAFNKFVERSAGNGEDVKWLKLKSGESVNINFLQEIDESSSNYNNEAGLVFIATEHSNPDDYRKKAMCTLEEEGRCVACELANRGNRGWKVRGRLYANVLVDNGVDDPYVAILSQGTSGKSITPSLVMVAADTGSITNMQFRIQRQGEGMKTEYQLMPRMGSNGVDASDYSLYDLEKIVTRRIPYDEQVEFYGLSETNQEEESSEDFSW